jgi:hypothetical protein
MAFELPEAEGGAMYRFEQLIRPSMTVREIIARYPETAEFFETIGFRSVCHDCTLDTVAMRQELSTVDVLQALRLVIHKHEDANRNHQ